MANLIFRNLKKSHRIKGSVLSSKAKVIISGIRSMNISKSLYLSISDFKESKNWVPKSLQILLRHIILLLKKRSIGQCVGQGQRL